jgi:peptidase M28-like protein
MNDVNWDSLWQAILAGGSRAMGTAGADIALQNIIAILTSLSCRLTRQPFPYPGWTIEGDVSLTLEGRGNVPAAAFLGSEGTTESPVRGRLKYIGKQRIWEGMYEWEKFGIFGTDRAPLAYVVVRPDGPAIPQLLPKGSRSVPHFIVGMEVLDLLAVEPLVEGILPAKTTPEAVGTNVIATFPGQRPEGSLSLLVGSHYDTVYGTPGAFDNASGVVSLLSLAHHLTEKPPACTVRLVFFAAEELNLAGSRAYAKDCAHREDLRDMRMINLDGMGRGDMLEVWASDENFEAWLFAHLPILPGRRVISRCPAPPGSDHAAFAELEVPSVLFTFNDLPILHHPSDVDDPRKRENTRLIVDLVRQVLEQLMEDPP